MRARRAGREAWKAFPAAGPWCAFLICPFLLTVFVMRSICMRTGSFIVCAFFLASSYCFLGAVSLHDSTCSGGGND